MSHDNPAKESEWPNEGSRVPSDKRERCEHGVVYPKDNCVECVKRELAEALADANHWKERAGASVAVLEGIAQRPSLVAQDYSMVFAALSRRGISMPPGILTRLNNYPFGEPLTDQEVQFMAAVLDVMTSTTGTAAPSPLAAPIIEQGREVKPHRSGGGAIVEPFPLPLPNGVMPSCTAIFQLGEWMCDCGAHAPEDCPYRVLHELTKEE